MYPCRRKSPNNLAGSPSSSFGSGANKTTFVPSAIAASTFTMSAALIRSNRSPVSGSCGIPAAAHSTRR